MQVYMTAYKNYRSYSRPKSKNSMTTMNFSTTYTAKRKRGSEDSESITYPSYMSTEKKIRTQ